MANVEKRTGGKGGDNLPARRFMQDVELHMDHIEFDDETEDYEALATRRSMRRGIELAEFGLERAGKSEVSQRIVLAHVQAFTENSLARQRRRMMGDY
ncbi:hypothetical protein [Rhodococcus rhodochrous]|uniref:hypothetical protein n=1 Tax=Rhodococcus rhodochrous TaxID=1829 RepID=UPI001780303C|nr:hypothetical protein [Rhodococcus rhodochrous]QOH56268.1 hypothetical protein C6Y44_10035 [Rhodococcus rhodochrous]